VGILDEEELVVPGENPGTHSHCLAQPEQVTGLLQLQGGDKTNTFINTFTV
jgi:hypothetical protein